MKSYSQQIFAIIVVLGVVVVITLVMLPKPVPVELATIQRGPLVVTVTDDGRTRIRERYVVSAPLSGRLVRIRHKPGDEVIAHETQLTMIEPTDPALLDPRSIVEAEARVKTASARVKKTKPLLDSAQVALDHTETEMGRLAQLVESDAATDQDLEDRRFAYQQAINEYKAARFEVEIAGFELDVAKAALTRGTDDAQANGWSFPVTSPISGRVLRVFQESATILNAGERILEIGDPADLEVEVDILSTDAVRIRPGSRVMLEQWGGSSSLPARVRLIEPSAFTKVSALGIEEQRVNVIIDFDLQEYLPPLQDGYRVEASIVEWESDDVLTVPAGALFREGTEWAVFVAEKNRAKLTLIELGHRNDDEAEVLDGLKQGEQVILYPGDRIEDGVKIEQ